MLAINCDQFHKTILSLIEINKAHRGFVPQKVVQQMSPVAFARDFCTVHINIGRRTGKTEFIRRFSTDKSAIVVATPEIRRLKYGRRPNTFAADDLKFPIVTATPDIVFVYEPAAVFRIVPREFIYGAFRNDGTLTFVMLGE